MKTPLLNYTERQCIRILPNTTYSKSLELFLAKMELLRELDKILKAMTNRFFKLITKT